MGKNSKRSKSYYINSSKRRAHNELQSDMMGFLCTCNMNEKACLKEAYNLLNEFSNILYSKQEFKKNNTQSESDSIISQLQTSEKEKNTQSDSESEEDIECALKDEVEALQNSAQAGKHNSRFQQVFVRVNNCIFISTTIPNPVELSLFIMDEILKQQKTRTKHLVRMVPVQKTCKAFLEYIEKATEELIIEHFPKGKVSFYIACKIRNNNSIQREDVLKSLSHIITSYNLEAIADYKIPELVLNIDILKNICCLGLLPHYLTKYCKYNLLKLLQPNEDEEEKVKDPKVEIISDKKEAKDPKAEITSVEKEVKEPKVEITSDEKKDLGT